MRALVVAEGDTFKPPGAGDFILPPLIGSGQWALTKPMLLVVLSMVVVAAYFLLSSRKLAMIPGKGQFVAESIYDFSRNNITREQIGSKDFKPYIPLVLSLFTFILVNNIFGVIPLLQFPTLSHFGFPLALSLLVVYPVYHFVGFKRHGFIGYFKHQTIPPGAPGFILPLLIPIEFLQKFIMNPLTLAIRVFAAMFAGHLILLVFTLGGEFLLLHASGALKPVSIVAFLFSLAMTLLEAFIQVLQAYIFAILSASYIGAALSSDH